MRKHLFVLLLATWASTGLSFAQASSATSSSTKSATHEEQSALAAKLVAQEKESWEACKRHDATAFANLCRDDEYEIFGDGKLLTVKEVIAQIPDTDILEYTMEDVRVFVLNEQTAIVRYRILAKVSYKGEVSPAQWMLASAVWIKMGQTWKAAMYQETPLPKE